MKKKLPGGLILFLIVWAGALSLAFYLRAMPDGFTLFEFPDVEIVNKLGGHFFSFVKVFLSYLDFVANIFDTWFNFLYNYLGNIISQIVEIYESVMDLLKNF